MLLAKGNPLTCESLVLFITTVNDKGLLQAKAGAGTRLPAYVAFAIWQWELPKDS